MCLSSQVTELPLKNWLNISLLQVPIPPSKSHEIHYNYWNGHNRLFVICVLSRSEKYCWNLTMGSRRGRIDGGEKKQRKVHVLKKMENISRAWCSIEHAEQTLLWNSEANSGVVPHQTDIVDNLSLSVFLNFCCHVLLELYLVLFLFLLLYTIT